MPILALFLVGVLEWTHRPKQADSSMRPNAKSLKTAVYFSALYLRRRLLYPLSYGRFRRLFKVLDLFRLIGSPLGVDLWWGPVARFPARRLASLARLPAHALPTLRDLPALPARSRALVGVLRD